MQAASAKPKASAKRRRNKNTANPERAIVPYVPPVPAASTQFRNPGTNRAIVLDKRIESKLSPPQVDALVAQDRARECTLRLMKVRADPFGNVSQLPCNTSSTSANTIRYKTFHRSVGYVGTMGYGFAAVRSAGGSLSDVFSVITTTATYAGVGMDTTAVGTAGYTQSGGLFTSTDIQASGIKIEVRRVATAIRVTPIAAPVNATGYFQPWRASGNDYDTTITDVDLSKDSISPIVGYDPSKCYMVSWQPNRATQEGWVPEAELVASIAVGGADLALLWIGARAGDPFLVETINYYEAESFEKFSNMAMPSEHDPIGAARVNTALTKVNRTNLAIPIGLPVGAGGTRHGGFLEQAWDTIKSEGLKFAKNLLPGIATTAGRSLLALL